MAENSAISWTKHSWNPWMGCTKVSPACDGCYAEALMDHRFGQVAWGNNPRRRTGAKQLEACRTMRRLAPLSRIASARISTCQHSWEASVALWHAKTRPLFNFVSCEPLLEEFDLTDFPEDPYSQENAGYRIDALRGKIWLPKGANTLTPGHVVGEREYVGLCHKIDWVITGGETDQGEHRARPTHPDAFWSLRDQCAAARVPFHHKQNGEWMPVTAPEGDAPVYRFPGGVVMQKLGADNTGRLLDGVAHDQFPLGRIAA